MACPRSNELPISRTGLGNRIQIAEWLGLDTNPDRPRSFIKIIRYIRESETLGQIKFPRNAIHGKTSSNKALLWFTYDWSVAQ